MTSIIHYSENEQIEIKDIPFYEAWQKIGDSSISWLNIEGLASEDFQTMTTLLELHPLMVEDIKSKGQLPKFEQFDTVSFLSVQMVRRHPVTRETFTEHLSIVLGNNFIISLQDNKEGDVFDGLRQKIRNNYKRIAKNGIDYLFLSLVGAIVDEYIATIMQIRQPIEDMELSMAKRRGLNLMVKIMEYKTELSRLRKFTTPLKEELQRIRVENPELIRKQNQALFRDILDHLSTLIANFDGLRELLRDLTDLQNSNQNLVLGNTMKTLTVISAVFIPLTFIVGVYGMNFDFMPGLHAKYGFWSLGAVMLLLTLALIFYMKRKKWF